MQRLEVSGALEPYRCSIRGCTAPLTFKVPFYIYIYSTNIGTEYFKHVIYSPFLFLFIMQFFFIILTHLVPVLFTVCIQGVLKLKKKIRRQNVNIISRADTFLSRHKPEQIYNKFRLTCFYSTNRTAIKFERKIEYILDITDRLQTTLLHSVMSPLIVQFSATNLSSSYILSDLYNYCYSYIIQTRLWSSLSLLCHSTGQTPYKFILFCRTSWLLTSILDNGRSLMKFSIL